MILIEVQLFPGTKVICYHRIKQTRVKQCKLLSVLLFSFGFFYNKIVFLKEIPLI